jgi:hypothetical protein
VGWTLADKTLTNLTFFPTIPVGGPPSGDFSFIYDDFTPLGLTANDEWTTLAVFDPSLGLPSTGSYSYDLAINAPGWTFKSVELDVTHSGSGQDVTKVVKDAIGSPIATLNSLRAPRKISAFQSFCGHEKAANQAA